MVTYYILVITKENTMDNQDKDSVEEAPMLTKEEKAEIARIQDIMASEPALHTIQLGYMDILGISTSGWMIEQDIGL